MSKAELTELISGAWPELTEAQKESVLRFYELLVDENSRQNLTRLTSPKDFLEGHLLDVKELIHSGLAEFPAMDLGSGGGVPGLLAAALGFGNWVLADSEGQKAKFLARAAKELGIENRVRVFEGRGEEFLKEGRVVSVVARAVGPVDRIYAWLRPCSTWNNLILLKGPAWEEEWQRFQASKNRRELAVSQSFAYEVGAEKKKRLIIRLLRVPRGTK